VGFTRTFKIGVYKKGGGYQLHVCGLITSPE
jgi:hypothetical protein